MSGDEKLQMTKKDMQRTQEIAENTIQRMKKLQIRLAQSLNRLDKQMDNARDAVENAFTIVDEDSSDNNNHVNNNNNNISVNNNNKTSSSMNFTFVQTSLHSNSNNDKLHKKKLKTPSKLSIAMLIRNPPIIATHTFIKYHLNLGFEKIYFFFDDIYNLGEDKEIMSILQTMYPENVFVYHCTSDWYVTFSFEDYEKYIYTDLVARQIVAVKQALKIANNDGMNWLLHIDIDELFCFNDQQIDNMKLINSNTVTTTTTKIINWFTNIPSHIDQVRFINYEAAPENIELVTNDYFKEITLFKPNPSIIKKSIIRQHWPIEDRKFFFTAYSNGKSAVRCDMKKNVSLSGAHSFCFENHQLQDSEKILSVDAADIDIINGTNQDITNGSPIILHYPHCSYKLWLQKYKRLGNFPNLINGKDEIPTDSFHIKSRDIVAITQQKNEGNDFKNKTNVVDNDAKCFFSNTVIFLNKNEVDTLINAGLLVRLFV